MFTRLYIKYNSKFFYLSTSQFKFHLNLVHDFHKTLNGEYLLQALRWFPSFSLFTLHYISGFFSLRQREEIENVLSVLQGHTMCVIVPGFKECTIMFDCSQIYIIWIQDCCVVFPVTKNIWGKEFSVYNFIFILISILFKTMFHHEIT